MTIFTWIVVASWAVFLFYWAVSSLNTKKSTTNYWRAFGVRILLVVIVLVVFQNSIFARIRDYRLATSNNPSLAALGALLCVIGVSFAVWARYHLGQNWGMPRTIRENPELVTSGPYAYVRHPIYTGVLLALLGTAFVTNITWIISFVLGTLYFIYSGIQEEKVMLEKFPDTYPAYKKRTKMLVPFLF